MLVRVELSGNVPAFGVPTVHCENGRPRDRFRTGRSMRTNWLGCIPMLPPDTGDLRPCHAQTFLNVCALEGQRVNDDGSPG